MSAYSDHEAMYYTMLDDGRAACELCPHNCRIAPGGVGLCRVRKNEGGRLLSLIYGRACSISVDPIEKKPLYHFYPGKPIASLGTMGCNLKCRFCQNYSISQLEPGLSEISVADAVAAGSRSGSIGISYTYNEPLIWYEFVLDTAREARKAGLKNVLVSNGYINRAPLEELLPHIDAINFDLKSVRDRFYKKLCGASAAPVFESVKLAAKSVLLEVTNLIIPGENDSDDDLTDLADWILDNLGASVPAHLSAYYPTYKLDNPATPLDTLERAFDIFSARLKYVYLGNVRGPKGNDTRCGACGRPVVTRSGYFIDASGLEGDRCSHCGAATEIIN